MKTLTRKSSPRLAPESGSVGRQHAAHVTNRDTSHMPEVPSAGGPGKFAQSDEAICRRFLQTAFETRDCHRRAVQHLAEIRLVQVQPIAQRIDALCPAWKRVCDVNAFLAHERHSTYLVRHLEWHFRGSVLEISAIRNDRRENSRQKNFLIFFGVALPLCRSQASSTWTASLLQAFLCSTK